MTTDLTEDLDRVAALTKGHDLQWPYVSEVALKASATLKELEAEVARLREVLFELIQQTHNCERELTEDLHHVDFCGESVPLTNAREALKKAT